MTTRLILLWSLVLLHINHNYVPSETHQNTLYCFHFTLFQDMCGPYMHNIHLTIVVVLASHDIRTQEWHVMDITLTPQLPILNSLSSALNLINS